MVVEVLPGVCPFWRMNMSSWRNRLVESWVLEEVELHLDLGVQPKSTWQLWFDSHPSKPSASDFLKGPIIYHKTPETDVQPENKSLEEGGFRLRKSLLFKVLFLHVQEFRFRLSSWCVIEARWRLKEWNWWRRKPPTLGMSWFYFKVTMTTIGVFIDYILTDELYMDYIYMEIWKLVCFCINLDKILNAHTTWKENGWLQQTLLECVQTLFWEKGFPFDVYIFQQVFRPPSQYLQSGTSLVAGFHVQSFLVCHILNHKGFNHFLFNPSRFFLVEDRVASILKSHIVIVVCFRFAQVDSQ